MAKISCELCATHSFFLDSFGRATPIQLSYFLSLFLETRHESDVEPNRSHSCRDLDLHKNLGQRQRRLYCRANGLVVRIDPCLPHFIHGLKVRGDILDPNAGSEKLRLVRSRLSQQPINFIKNIFGLPGGIGCNCIHLATGMDNATVNDDLRHARIVGANPSDSRR